MYREHLCNIPGDFGEVVMIPIFIHEPLFSDVM